MARTKKRRATTGSTSSSGTQRPIKLTRGHLTAREHKDMSTHELHCRIAAKTDNAEIHDVEIERLTTALKVRRAAVRIMREDIAALEALVEGRR